MEYSKESLEYLDPETNEKYIPYVVEPSLGVERLFLTVLCDAYHKEQLENEEREVLKLHPFLAPIKVTVLPLVKKYHQDKALEVYKDLSKYFMTSYDETASIGKRYRRADVVGTPFCVTVDDETMNNGTVTVRHRDTMEQEVVKLEDLRKYIEERIEF
jgi:glycyl-tRNA synthetase